MNDLCVVFDIDDTLYLERDYVRSGFRAVGSWAQRWLGIDHFEAACLREFEAGRRSTIFNQALSACGIEPAPELISGLVEIYRTHEPCIQLAPDASQALGELTPHCPIAVISDGPVTSQSRKADALGLRRIASPVILTEAWGQQFRKPHTRAFREVATRVPARRYVYIADNPGKDFKGPRELGWATIRIRRTEGLHYSVESDAAAVPDFELPDCSRIARTIAEI
jgi:putative hydrolase of the HAD superfamily